MTPWSVVTGPVTYEVPVCWKQPTTYARTSIWALPDMLQAAGDVHDVPVTPETPPAFTATIASAPRAAFHCPVHVEPLTAAPGPQTVMFPEMATRPLTKIVPVPVRLALPPLMTRLPSR